MSNTLRSVPVSVGSVAVRTDGDPARDALVFLHGWPQDHTAWDRVIAAARETHHCVALDLPGIGGSPLPGPRGDKRFLARVVREVVVALGLDGPVLVGHDIGGMVAYAYLREFADLRGAALVDTIVPGVPPWDRVVANPALWHFGFHAVPELPERLVGADPAAYFDHFYDAVAADPAALPASVREHYVSSYRAPGSLAQGFAFYRAFAADATANRADATPTGTPVLYVRGGHGGRSIDAYAAGLTAAGLAELTAGTVPGAGHYTPEEQPDRLWSAIEDWLPRTVSPSQRRPDR